MTRLLFVLRFLATFLVAAILEVAAIAAMPFMGARFDGAFLLAPAIFVRSADDVEELLARAIVGSFAGTAGQLVAEQWCGRGAPLAGLEQA